MGKKIRHIPPEITEALNRGAEGNSVILDWLGALADRNATCGKMMYYATKVFACFNTADQITRSTINDLLTNTILLKPTNDVLIKGLLDRRADPFAVKDGAQSLITVLVTTANKAGMDALMKNGFTLDNTDKAGKTLKTYILESANSGVQAWVGPYEKAELDAAEAARIAEEAAKEQQAKAAEQKAVDELLAKIPAPLTARLEELSAQKEDLTRQLAALRVVGGHARPVTSC
jgi:hypothetical protein